MARQPHTIPTHPIGESRWGSQVDICFLRNTGTDPPSVGPDLCPNCLQRLSADEKRARKVYKVFTMPNFIKENFII